ncbi:hypothetical protein GCM10009618_00920 [Nesterenkonia lacusekhoensis]
MGGTVIIARPACSAAGASQGGRGPVPADVHGQGQPRGPAAHQVRDEALAGCGVAQLGADGHDQLAAAQELARVLQLRGVGDPDLPVEATLPGDQFDVEPRPAQDVAHPRPGGRRLPHGGEMVRCHQSETVGRRYFRCVSARCGPAQPAPRKPGTLPRNVEGAVSPLLLWPHLNSSGTNHSKEPPCLSTEPHWD